MLIMVVSVVLLTLIFRGTNATSSELQKTYTGWQVLQVELKKRPKDNKLFEDFLDLEKDTYSMQLLGKNRNRGVAEVAVSPQTLTDFTHFLTINNITFTSVVDDLGNKIESTGASERAEYFLNGDVTFDRYMNHDEIISYLELLPRQYPHLVKLTVAGRSVEGRPLHLLTITSSHSSTKPVIFIDGGIHAREWISPAAALNVVGHLLQTPKLTRNLEWKVMPLINPDGYIYSWTKDRLWRKNRAWTQSASCVGVDLNRNFDFHWGEAGSSDRPCSPEYIGSQAFSEPETRTLRDILLRDYNRTQAFVSIHSYGQAILHPWSYTTTATRSNAGRLERVGKDMVESIFSGERVSYIAGTFGELFYTVSGTSGDYAAGVGEIPLVYTLELRDTGAAGFILPKELIIPTVNDAWLAIEYLANHVIASDLVASELARSQKQQRRPWLR
ncbi:hypothetical protein OTU49_010161 [Cherax quadricarinatus]|uniref:Peptidase M14 domain-containing protein n=1 Tax=Cherax quadricarinatus TaxID=27406 RepID=A0AAW0WL78_CHEQU